MRGKILLATVISALVLVNAVVAEELPNPGLLPDSPFYPVKTFLEKVRLWLTFDPEARSRFKAFLAEQRLAELNATIAKGNFQYVKKLEKDYEDEVNETENEMNRTFGLGKNATALAEHVCNVTYKHISVLQRVLEKAPEAAKSGLERAINASIKGHENCLGRLEKVLNETNETVRRFSCTSDAECANLTVKCPAVLGYQTDCFIPENRTVGFCRCIAKWNKTVTNCTDDTNCRGIVCPMIVGNDTPICLNGRCECGGKWEIVNKTEWRERFGGELTNETEQIQEKIRERIEGCHKYYSCPDGTRVPWCFKENNKCVCIISPENKCPGTELVLDNIYSLGTPIEIKVKNKAASSIYYEASGCGPAYMGTYVVSSSSYGKINIAKPCGICPTLLKIEEIKPNETKTIDTWNQKQYDKECNCTTNSTCGERYVNEGTYAITFYYNFQTSKLFSKVVSKDIKILKPAPSQ